MAYALGGRSGGRAVTQFARMTQNLMDSNTKDTKVPDQYYSELRALRGEIESSRRQMRMKIAGSETLPEAARIADAIPQLGYRG